MNTRNLIGYKYQTGRTLIEILFVIVIIVVLAAIVALSFSGFKKGQALPTGVDEVVALLNEARSRTLAAENGLQYGVHLASDRAVLFNGTTYASGTSTNKTIMMDSTVTITSITLTGGGADVVFNKLTGETSQYGTLIVKNTSTTVGQKTITITKTGLISSN